MLRLLMFLAVLLYATVPLATADQYWVACQHRPHAQRRLHPRQRRLRRRPGHERIVLGARRNRRVTVCATVDGPAKLRKTSGQTADS